MILNSVSRKSRDFGRRVHKIRVISLFMSYRQTALTLCLSINVNWFSLLKWNKAKTTNSQTNWCSYIKFSWSWLGYWCPLSYWRVFLKYRNQPKPFLRWNANFFLFIMINDSFFQRKESCYLAPSKITSELRFLFRLYPRVNQITSWGLFWLLHNT